MKENFMEEIFEGSEASTSEETKQKRLEESMLLQKNIESFKEELDKIKTKNDTVDFDCSKILEILDQCTREQAASITHILRTKLVKLKPKEIKFTEENKDDNQFMSTPEIWWNSKNPEQQLLALLTLNSFNHSYYKRMIPEKIQKAHQESTGEDKEKFEVKFGDCHLQQNELIISEEALKRIERIFEEERFTNLQSSFDLIQAVLKHQKEASDDQFLKELAKNPIIINLGGLTFHGSTTTDDKKFTKQNLQYANFQGCKFSHFNLENNNFTGANLDDCEFIFSDDTFFYDNNFSDAIINFERTKKFPSSLFDKNKFDSATLKNFDFSMTKNGEVVTTDLTRFSFRGVTLESCNLTGALLPKDFSYAKILSCTLNKTKISDGNFENADLSGTTFHEATFKTILGTTFKNTTMVNTDLSEAIFTGAKKAEFKNCTLINTKFPKQENENKDWLNKKDIQQQFLKSPKTIEQVATIISDFQKRRIHISADLKDVVNQTICGIFYGADNMKILLSMIKSLPKIKDFPIEAQTYHASLKKFFNLIILHGQQTFALVQFEFIVDYINSHDDQSRTYFYRFEANKNSNMFRVPEMRKKKMPATLHKQQERK